MSPTQGECWLTDRLAYWQRQLRLQDWEITAQFGSASEMRGPSGHIDFEVSSKEARIRILAENEWPVPSTRYGVWDTEFFLIHELLHVHLIHWGGDATENGTPEWEAKEQAIDLIASALLRLERGERR